MTTSGDSPHQNKLNGWFRAKRRVRKRGLLLERLEARYALHGRDALSPAPRELTISFAPDGTNIDGHRSDLFAEFRHIENWQSTIVEAFKTWAKEIGASVKVVQDSGAEFGAGDPARFGEIRIGATSLKSDTYAIGISRFADVGTWAGDILFNSDVTLASRAELYAVALHEAGHVLGLDHSTNPYSPMFEHGIPQGTTPTSADIAALERLYQVTPSRNERSSPDQSRGRGRKHESQTLRNEIPPMTVGNPHDPHASVSYLVLNTLLSSSRDQLTQYFAVAEPTLLVLQLSTTNLSDDDDGYIATKLKTADGLLVDRFYTDIGSSRQHAVLLIPGLYQVQMNLKGPSESELIAAISLSAASYSSSLGPGISDPTSSPVSPSWEQYFGDYTVVITDPLVWPSVTYAMWAGMF